VQNLFSKGPQGFEDYGSEGSEQWEGCVPPPFVQNGEKLMFFGFIVVAKFQKKLFWNFFRLPNSILSSNS
jgi:hypothetical protein